MLEQGIPVAEIAKENGLSRPTIYKIKKANDLQNYTTFIRFSTALFRFYVPCTPLRKPIVIS